MLINAQAQAAMIDNLVAQIEVRKNQFDMLTAYVKDVSAYKLNGDTIKVAKLAIGAAEVVTEGWRFTSIDPTLSQATIVVDKRVWNVVTIADATVEDAALDILAETINAIVDQIMISVNAQIISTIVSNMVIGSTVTGASTYDRVKAAASLLDARKAPALGRKIFLTRSELLDLLNSTDTLNRVTGVSFDGYKATWNYLGFELVVVDPANLPSGHALAVHTSVVAYFIWGVSIKTQEDLEGNGTKYNVNVRFKVDKVNEEFAVELAPII